MNIKKLSYDALSVYLAAIQDIDRSRRERERKTVAALARHALSDCGELCHLPSGAPYVSNVEASISISHSRQTAALAVGLPGQSIGVDIESPREQLLNVAARVLSERELAIYGSRRPRTKPPAYPALTSGATSCFPTPPKPEPRYAPTGAASESPPAPK